jgi:CMP-N-acetylneuraminic acid synthetase
MSHGCSHFDTYNGQHVAALILARGGSKGIPQKNLAKIKGTSLLKRSLVAIHEFGSKYIVLTLVLIICDKYFSNVCILR